MKKILNVLRFSDAIKNARLKRKLSLAKASMYCKIPTIRLTELEEETTTINPSRYELRLLHKAYQINFSQYRYSADLEKIKLNKDIYRAMATNNSRHIFYKYGIIVSKH
jgi:transcriptional regulator with XRE-family HTH domain